MSDINEELLAALEGVLPMLNVSDAYLKAMLEPDYYERVKKARDVAAKARSMLARDAH